MNRHDEQIVLGTILGGSSIVRPKRGKHCYLSMRDKRGKWLEWKAFQLAHYASPKPFTIERTNRWHSLCHPDFDAFKSMFYNEQKRVLNIENLNFWDLGLAVWFGDCGRFENGKIVINTHIWGMEGSETLVKYFDLCGWRAKIFKDRCYFRIRLDRESSVRFLKTINYLLPFPLT